MFSFDRILPTRKSEKKRNKSIERSTILSQRYEKFHQIQSSPNLLQKSPSSLSLLSPLPPPPLCLFPLENLETRKQNFTHPRTIVSRIDLRKPWAPLRSIITSHNNVGQPSLKATPHLIRARKSPPPVLAYLQSQTCLPSRCTAIIIIMPLFSQACTTMAREHFLLPSPSRVLATRIATKMTTTTTTTKVGETDVELANQISPGIISARAAKQPAARRQGRVQDGRRAW